MLYRKWLLCLSTTITLASQGTVNAVTLNTKDPTSIRRTARMIAHNMMTYYNGNETGQTPGKLPDDTWWEGGAMFMTLIQYWYWTGDTTYNEPTSQALLHQKGENNNFFPRNYTLYLGNDDQMFWALAAMTAAELNFPQDERLNEDEEEQPSWVSLAQALFNVQIPRWDMSACGGGLRWQVWPHQAGYTTKNAISNGGLFQLAARLGRYTRNETYIAWAEKIWDWSLTTPLLKTENWSIADTTSMATDCADHGDQQWTYNYGAYLSGAVYMYNLTVGDEKWKEGIDGLLNTTFRTFFPHKTGGQTMSEIWCEQTMTCDRNQDLFKGFLSSWMTFLTTLAPYTNDKIIPRIQQSAIGAANQCAGGDSSTQCGRRWYQEEWDGTASMKSDMSALSVISSSMIAHKRDAKPLTLETGATSKSNPNAGIYDKSAPNTLRGIMMRDTVGASVATVVFFIFWISGFSWLVFPRDQAPPSNSFSFRSLLGDRERDDASRTSSGTASGKPASFLIVLENPDDVTLGGLAGMIREKWRKLRPGAEPIAIKKLLDDDHESDDLDTDMTVADVFVDKGKARLDGLDQRRIVRVIQKPASGVESPVRFPSVAQDWDAAAERYEMQRREKSKKEAEFALNKLGPITEEAQESAPTSPMHMDSWSDYTPGRKHRRDIPLSSVEKDHEVPLSPSQQPRKSLTHEPSQEPTVEDSSAPQENRLGSEELGDSPRSSRATTPRKPPSRRGSIQSEKFVNQSENARVVDSPGDQLVRESTHSTKPDLALLNGNPRAEETASNGDVTMVEDSAPKTQSPMTQEPITVIDNSAEQSSPKKEPRLDQSTPPPSVNRARRDSEVSPGTPRFSPSDYAEQPSTGLGLGITRSPKTASSSLPQSTPVPVSASNGLRETLGDKHLNSAMRKDSPASRDPARRSSQPAPSSSMVFPPGEKKSRDELEQKLKAAQKDKLNPNRQGSKLTTANLRAQHEKQLSEIKDMEASLGTKLQGKGKKAEAAKKTTKPQQNAKDNAPVSKAPTAKKKSPVTQIAGWNAPAAPTVNGTDKTNTIKARTPSLQSQTSTASDDVELPTMKSGSSTSDSDSDSESESDSPKTKKSPAAKTSNKPTPIPSNSKLKPSPPSAQRATKSPGPSTASQSQSQPASQTWHFPGSQRLGLSRPSLKSARELASKAQQEAAAKAAPKRNINGPPRKDIFERPDSSSSDETETSSSESESSDSDSDSEKEKANGKRAKEQSPVSVGDEGDIMSSGHVKKLRPARMTS
ncbi:glycosyl hydrolase family 76-domain-containing protein [Aspergillus karnatakaensis]|uniref:glycosyl hydrolase family 76-domain-containing protein n=1 Tax=Aspergillus karnatakaensis TaxID=1810916 RepID=UPI003CCD1CBF